MPCDESTLLPPALCLGTDISDALEPVGENRALVDHRDQSPTGFCDWSQSVCELLGRTQVQDFDFDDFSCDDAFSILREWTLMLRTCRRTVYAIGTGPSATLADHFTVDLARSGQTRTRLFTESAPLTAAEGSAETASVYARPLHLHGVSGDILVVVSHNGTPTSLLNAVDVAWEEGLRVVTLSGGSEANPLRRLGHLNFFVPAPRPELAQAVHAVLLQYWCYAMDDPGENRNGIPLIDSSLQPERAHEAKARVS